MSRRTRRTARNTVEVREAKSQLDHLVIMRESARYDEVLMEGMIQQTLAKVSHLAGADELASAGMDVFRNPERWGATVRRSGSSRMAMVERDGVLYVYSMGTAAKNDLADTNAFIAELVRIIESYRPADTWVIAFTRLLRSANFVGELFKVFGEHTKVLHCEAEIDMTTPEGRMLFQMLGMIAAMERDYMVRRHTAGRVAQWRRGEWIPNAFPPGYRKVNDRLVLDTSTIDQTRAMLAILGNPAFGPAECAARIGALGITTQMVQKLHGDTATIADAQNPSEVISTLAGWVEVYATGHYEMLWPNAFPGVKHVAGLDVEEVAGYEFGALRLGYRLAVPDDGWTDDATLEGIRRRYSKRLATGGASHSSTPPLAAMFSFCDDTSDYALRSGPGGTYDLLRRPHLHDRRFDGWKAESADGIERLGKVRRVELHRSIADGVVAAVRRGLPADLNAQRFQALGPLPRLDAQRARARAVRRQLDDAEAGLARARRNAALAEQDEAAALFIEDVKTYLADRTRLTAELDTLEQGIAEPEIGEEFESCTELVAHAIAALGTAGNSSPISLRDALRTIVHNERWRIEGDDAHWELWIELPHPDGTVTLGPIRGTIPNLLPRRRATVKRRQPATSVAEFVELGLPESAARAAVACPDETLIGVLSAHLGCQDLPETVDPDWARHVVDIYTDPEFRWNQGHWRLADDARRSGLSIVSAAGGRLDRRSILRAGLSENQLRYLTRVTNAPSGAPILRRLDLKRNATFGLLECPHCGGHADHSVVTPETRPGVLCSACWRAPTPNSPVFPAMYRS